MIKNAKLVKEIAVRVVNKIGVLADISNKLAEHGVNIEAVAGYAKDNSAEAEIILVTTDNLRTVELLKKNAYNSVGERDALMVELENTPGALKKITEKLAKENIDIKYIYGTACSMNCPAKIVLSTSDDQKALVEFKK